MTITPMMILRCGLTNALDLCLTGRMMDGKEAARIGLINRAVPADKLEEEVNRYAEGFAKFPLRRHRHGQDLQAGGLRHHGHHQRPDQSLSDAHHGHEHPLRGGRVQLL